MVMFYFAFKTKRISNIKDTLLFLSATCVFITGLYFGMMYYKTYDTLILNGSVTDKKREEVSCSHSYQCNCTTDSKGNRSCQTCYDHSFDVDWNVYSDVGNTTISREDRQGLVQPKRWDAVVVGEPYSRTESYTNYVLGNETSLYNYKNYNKKWVSLVPEYPFGIYDYYKAKRILQLGTSINTSLLEQEISNMLRTVGPTKQANVILVLTNNPDHTFVYSVRDKWLNGKKNDIVVVLGMNGNIINWVESFSWNKNTYLPIMLQQQLVEKDITNVPVIINELSTVITKYYVRKPMAEFEYLTSTITLTTGQILFVLFMSILLPILSVVFINKYSYNRFHRPSFSTSSSRFTSRTSFNKRFR